MLLVCYDIAVWMDLPGTVWSKCGMCVSGFHSAQQLSDGWTGAAVTTNFCLTGCSVCSLWPRPRSLTLGGRRCFARSPRGGAVTQAFTTSCQGLFGATERCCWWHSASGGMEKVVMVWAEHLGRSCCGGGELGPGSRKLHLHYGWWRAAATAASCPSHFH